MALKESGGLVRRISGDSDVVPQAATFQKFSNPYTFGVPVQQAHRFFGREEELQLIFDTLERVPRGQKQDLAVLGPRRIGKSSLLYRLLDSLQTHPDFVPVYLDVQNIKPRKVRPLFLKMLWQIQKGYEHKGLADQLPTFDTLTAAPPPDLEFLTFDEDMSRLNKIIAAHNLPRLVLMFDEVELLLDFGGRDTLDWFRSLIQSMLYTVFTVAGSDQLYSLVQDYGSPFFNIFKTVELFPLTTAAARKLIEEPMAEIGLEMPPAAVDKILNVTGNTPYFIQGIGHYLVAELNQQQRRRATAVDIDKVIAASVQYLSPQFRYLWNIASRTQQVVLYTLAKTNQPQTMADLVSRLPAVHNLWSSRQQQRDIFQDLVHQQILKVVDETHYWFVVPLFANWTAATVDDAEIIKQATMTPDTELRNQQYDIDMSQTLRQIVRHFTQEELKTLAFDLYIDYESLGGIAKADQARELILYLARHRRLPELLRLLRQERPNIAWSE